MGTSAASRFVILVAAASAVVGVAVATPAATGAGGGLASIPAASKTGSATCDFVLPHCAAERARWVDDWGGWNPRCSGPNGWIYRYGPNPVVPTISALFSAITAAHCCATAAQKGALEDATKTLIGAGVCGDHYHNVPAWDPAATACHAPSVCADVASHLQIDYSLSCFHWTVFADLYARRRRLTDTLETAGAAGCCTVPAQRRQMAADMMVLAASSTCTASVVTRVATRALVGGRQATPAVVAPWSAPAAAAAVAAAGRPPPVASVGRTAVWLDADNSPSSAVCCDDAFDHTAGCCSVWCRWVGDYLSALVGIPDCCIGANVWPRVASCAAL